MTWEETVYSEPLRFNPDRFLSKPLGKGEPFPTAVFGFGRRYVLYLDNGYRSYYFGHRVCPGRYLADASLWIAMASILATLDVTKAIGDDGKEITPPLKFISGIARYRSTQPVLRLNTESACGSHPAPFRCNIKPRDLAAQSLLAEIDTSDTY